VDLNGGRGGEGVTHVDVSSGIHRSPSHRERPSSETLGFRSLPFHHHLLLTEN